MNISELRKPKLFGLAIFDIAVGIIGLIILFIAMWKWHFPELNPRHFVIAAILLAIPIGIVFHVIFGVNTSLNARLGLSEMP